MRLAIAFGLIIFIADSARGTILDSTIADASTFIQSNDPNGDAKGSPPGSGLLEIKNINSSDPIGPWNRKAYIGFDLSDLNVADAYRLEMDMMDSGLGVTSPTDNWFFTVYAFVDPNANLGGLTWNNAPQNDITSGSSLLTTGATIVGSFGVQGKGVGTIQIMDSRLNDFVNANPTSPVLFALGRDTPGPPSYVHAVSAHGGTNPPVLHAVPAPSPLLGILGLVATGSAGYFLRHRRRR